MKRKDDFLSDLFPESLKRVKCSTESKRVDRVPCDASETTPRKPIRSLDGIGDLSASLTQEGLCYGKFGSVAKDLEARRVQNLGLVSLSLEMLLGKGLVERDSKPAFNNVIDLEDEDDAIETRTSKRDVITIDSDEDEDKEDRCGFDERPGSPFQNSISDQHSGATLAKDKVVIIDYLDSEARVDEASVRGEFHPEVKKEKDVNSVCELEDSTVSGEEDGLHGEVCSEVEKEEDNFRANETKKEEDDTPLRKAKRDKDASLASKSKRDEDAIMSSEIKKDEATVASKIKKSEDGASLSKAKRDKDAALTRESKRGEDDAMSYEIKKNEPTVASKIKKNEDDASLSKAKTDKDASLTSKSRRDKEATSIKEIAKDKDAVNMIGEHKRNRTSIEDTNRPAVEIVVEKAKDKGTYVGVEEDEENRTTSSEDDELEDIWNELSLGLELSKDNAIDHLSKTVSEEDEEKCEHSCVFKDDIGFVCRICGVIDRGIETIFEFQYKKVRSSRTYIRLQNGTGNGTNGLSSLDLNDDDVMPEEIYAHPRHTKTMKPHQKEGFDFLTSNLAGKNPGGCILAHAPGTGKTFMIICFLQSFMAKYPNSRPLVVLPKGIIPTWKKEFQIWQIEDFPLYETKKEHSRVQHLEILKQWVESRSVLFLSYQQFSCIVCDPDSHSNAVASSCRDLLLKVPSILVLDEGHTPRNDNTDIFQSISLVQTPRKVVLSGTLYQNHVKEVFNIFDLVRPNFLKTETSQSIVNRIRSKVDLTLSGRKHVKTSGESGFYEIVEETLQREKDLRRKVSVIQDLREMTSKVLHYYKGDFLDDLPGLFEFTVFLNLTSKQVPVVEKVRKLPGNFKASSAGSAVYVHPKLMPYAESGTMPDDNEMDELLESLSVDDGVKAKFFLNIMNLCEATKEKLLVFSQYLLPLKFLERLAVQVNRWSVGREIFVISGNSSQTVRERSVEEFNASPEARVFFGSIKACGEGISLVGASRVIVIDTHLNPSVTRQAIGRAFRPGQTKKVFVYRLVAAESPEVEDYKICSKKEAISKSWFEWKEHCRYRDFEVETVVVDSCGDGFLEGNSTLEKDIKSMHRR